MTQNHSLIMKFGGASVATLSHFSRVSDLIIERKKHYKNVIAVVSAMQGSTDQLIKMAHEVNTKPPQREYDMLITVGERISCSLLAMALSAKGCHSMSFTGSQAGIITTEEHTDAKIIDVKPHRLLGHLHKGTVLVIAGFQGVSHNGHITSLGRGGSDTTAVALSIALGAKKVEYYKQFPGIYSDDPNKFPQACHFPTLDYEEALKITARTGFVLHPRSILLAQRNAVQLDVLSFDGNQDPTMNTIIRDERLERNRPDVAVYEASVSGLQLANELR